MIEIYTRGNYFLIRTDEKLYTEHRLDVKFAKGKTSSENYDIYIKNSKVSKISGKTWKNFTNEETLFLSQVAFEDFVFSNTGFNTASGGSGAVDGLVVKQTSTIATLKEEEPIEIGEYIEVVSYYGDTSLSGGIYERVDPIGAIVNDIDTIQTTAGEVYELRHNGTVTPYMFGTRESTLTDTPRLQRFFDYCNETKAKGDFRGTWFINATIVINGSNENVYECGRIHTINSGLDLAVDCYSEGSIFKGLFQIYGHETDITGVTYSQRNSIDGFYMHMESGRCAFDNFDIRGFKRYGITTKKDGANHNIIMNKIGTLKAWNCGSGNSATRKHTFNITGYTNLGTAGATSQTATIQLENAVDTAIDEFAIIDINGRLHQVRAVDDVNDILTIYPWVDTTITPTVGTPFEVTSMHGAGILIHGNNSASFKIDQVDTIGAGSCVHSAGLYGADIGVIQAQFCFSALTLGETTITIGTKVNHLYSEATPYTIIQRGFAVDNTSEINLIVGTPDKYYSFSPVDASNNILNFPPNAMAVTYKNSRYEQSVARKSKNDIRDNAVIKLSNRTNNNKVNIIADTSTIELEWDEGINKVFGYDTIELSQIGTGVSYEPTGTITFQLNAQNQTDGITVMGGTSFVLSSLSSVANYAITFDYDNQNWLVVSKGGGGDIPTVFESLEISKNDLAQLTLTRDEPTITDGEILGAIAFKGTDTLAEGVREAAFIKGIVENVWIGSQGGGAIGIFTRDLIQTPLERMRVTSKGLVGIGTTTPKKLLEVKGSVTIGSNQDFNLSGDVDPTASTTVAGTAGTKFLTEIEVGDRIRVGVEERTVIQIDSDTELIVDYPFTDAGNDFTPQIIASPLILKDPEQNTVAYTTQEGVTVAKQFKLSNLNTAPLSATDTGIKGEIRVTSTHIYVCTATDTWVRSTLSTW